jgi:hypothetical protein
MRRRSKDNLSCFVILLNWNIWIIRFIVIYYVILLLYI